jgi:Ti-type conjugative transfer relaxase TraA
MELTFSCSLLKRKNGSSPSGQAAYITRSKRKDARIRKSYNYDSRLLKQAAYIARDERFEQDGTRRTQANKFPEELVAEGLLLPDGAGYSGSREQFWNWLDQQEDALLVNRWRKQTQEEIDAKLASATVANRIIISLHNALPLAEAEALVEAFIAEQITAQGMAAEYAIHLQPGNLHVHILHSCRCIKDGRILAAKAKPFSERQQLEAWCLTGGARIAERQNLVLQEIGVSERVEHLSYKERGLPYTPQQHEGPAREASWRGEAETMPVALENERVREKNRELSLEQVESLLKELSSRQAVWSRTDLDRLIFRRLGLSHARFEEAWSKLLGSPDLVKIDTGSFKAEFYTTRYFQQAEADMLAAARVLSERTSILCDQKSLERRIKENYGHLVGEQLDALLHITGPGDLKSLVGIAGSGKTQALKPAVQQWKAEGHRVVALALSGIAADSLAKSTKADASATLARWEIAERALKDFSTGAKMRAAQEPYAINKVDVVIIDEAGMVGTAQMGRLLQHVRSTGAKIVLVGDPDQLAAIEAGDAFRGIFERHGSARLSKIRRHNSFWQKEASKKLAQGWILDALETYQEKGCISFASDRQDARRRIIESYAADVLSNPGQSRLALAYCEEDVEALNQGIRQALKCSNHLGPDIGMVAGQGWARGDRVVFGKNDCGSILDLGRDEAAALALLAQYDQEANINYDRQAMQTWSYQVALNWQHYKASRKNTCAFVRRLKSPFLKGLVKGWYDGRRRGLARYHEALRRDLLARARRMNEERAQRQAQGIRNGNAGRVIGMDGRKKRLIVRLDDGRIVAVGPDYDVLHYGYAVTLHKSQGQTVDRSWVLATRQLGADGAYVAMTRHRETCEIVADGQEVSRLRDLAMAWSRSPRQNLLADFTIYDTNDPRRRVAWLAETTRKNVCETASLVMVAKIMGETTSSWSKEKWTALTRQKEACKKRAIEIAQDLPAHQAALRMAGISRMQLEEIAGQRDEWRPCPERIKDRELVEAYATLSRETRDVYNVIKVRSGATVKGMGGAYRTDPDYQKLVAMRERRNELARRILADLPRYQLYLSSVMLSPSMLRAQIEKAERETTRESDLEPQKESRDFALRQVDQPPGSEVREIRREGGMRMGRRPGSMAPRTSVGRVHPDVLDAMNKKQGNPSSSASLFPSYAPAPAMASRKAVSTVEMTYQASNQTQGPVKRGATETIELPEVTNRPAKLSQGPIKRQRQENIMPHEAARSTKRLAPAAIEKHPSNTALRKA